MVGRWVLTITMSSAFITCTWHILLLLFSRSVMSDSLWPMDCSTPGFPVLHYLLKLMSIKSLMPSNHLIFCRPLLLLPSIFPSIRVFSSELALCIRWPNYRGFSFSNSPSKEYSGLISFRVHWFDLLVVQVTQDSSPAPQFESISSSMLSLLYHPTLISVHDYWKNHSFDRQTFVGKFLAHSSTQYLSNQWIVVIKASFVLLEILMIMLQMSY